MTDELISKAKLRKALTDKWNEEHPVYDDTSGSMTYSEIIDFIQKFPYESIVIKKDKSLC